MTCKCILLECFKGSAIISYYNFSKIIKKPYSAVFTCAAMLTYLMKFLEMQ